MGRHDRRQVGPLPRCEPRLRSRGRRSFRPSGRLGSSRRSTRRHTDRLPFAVPGLFLYCAGLGQRPCVDHSTSFQDYGLRISPPNRLVRGFVTPHRDGHGGMLRSPCQHVTVGHAGQRRGESSSDHQHVAPGAHLPCGGRGEPRRWIAVHPRGRKARGLRLPRPCWSRPPGCSRHQLRHQQRVQGVLLVAWSASEGRRVRPQRGRPRAPRRFSTPKTSLQGSSAW